MNGSMAIGSRRTTPTWPVADAVVSLPSVAPTYTPCSQLNARKTSGIARLRRQPKTIAHTGTPAGSSHAGSSAGLFVAGAVKRLLGWAAFRPQSGVQGWPVQSIRLGGGVLVLPSHQTSPSGARATLV